MLCDVADRVLAMVAFEFCDSKEFKNRILILLHRDVYGYVKVDRTSFKTYTDPKEQNDS